MSASALVVPERPLASHCPQLLRQQPEAASLLPRFGQIGERLARVLPGALAPLCGEAGLRAECAGTRELAASELPRLIAPMALNSLYSIGAGPARLLLSFPLEPVFRMVDRAFGGRGECPGELPDHLPTAGDLMAARVERLVIEALSGALGPAEAPALSLSRRGTSLAAIEAFAPGEPLALLVLGASEGEAAGWDLMLAVPIEALGLLLGEAGAGHERAAPCKPRPMAAATAAPFADLPLPLSAVLVDMAVPFSAVARLKVGQVLNVAVARSVPLRIGGQTIAHGNVGSADDRVAIQITRAFHA